jgi:hypothetical protein
MKLSMAQIAGYAIAAGFPPAEVGTATAVAMAESGGETTASNRNSNGSYDYGLWQINTIHGALLQQGDKFNPLDNAKMALTVWQRAGNKWTPWVVYKSGVYRIHLLQANQAAAKPENVTANPPIVSGSAPAVDNPNTGPVDALTGAVGSIGASITEGVKGITDTVNAFNDIIKRLTSGGYWLRIGAFFLGVLLLTFSMVRLSGTDKLIVGVGKTAIKARTGVSV